MKIGQYLSKLEGNNKRHVLLVVTPKGAYPTQYSYEEYYHLEKAILEKPKSYIDLYEEDEPEIMQFAAFRIFLKPIICDAERLYDKSLNRVKRLNKEEITSYFIARHFYDTVPYGEKNEEDAIIDGKTQFEKFIEKYPLDKFEFASVELSKDSTEANILIKINFKNQDKNFYFDYVYVH